MPRRNTVNQNSILLRRQTLIKLEFYTVWLVQRKYRGSVFRLVSQTVTKLSLGVIFCLLLGDITFSFLCNWFPFSVDKEVIIVWSNCFYASDVVESLF